MTDNDDIKTIGFVGLGTIGKPMATNLAKKGYSLRVFDLNQSAVADLIALGAEGRATAAAVAADSDALITMLPDAPDVEKAVLGPGGVAEGMRPGSIYIDMSTIDQLIGPKYFGVEGELSDRAQQQLAD
ncbi:MAG: NAD(P)-binding domain-containing protein, partial [Pseudomonadota bacterium]